MTIVVSHSPPSFGCVALRRRRRCISHNNHQQRRRRLPRSSRHANLYIITPPGRGNLTIKNVFNFVYLSRGLLLPGTLNTSLSVAFLCDCVLGVGDDDYEQNAFIIIGMRHVFRLPCLHWNIKKLRNSAFLSTWDPIKSLIARTENLHSGKTQFNDLFPRLANLQ